MSKINLVIFTDSTLTHSDLYSFIGKNDILKGAIKRGDLFYLLSKPNRPNLIIIIDGVFEQISSITHKEILWALSQGVGIIGISSIGALRAFELRTYGVLGYGEIYKDYVLEKINGDDEVAVSYRNIKGKIFKTIPMVNLRYTLKHLNIMDNDLIALLRNIHYKNRTWNTLEKILNNDIFFLLKEHYIDQKKFDVLSFFQSKIYYKYQSHNFDFYKGIFFKNEYIKYSYSSILDFIFYHIKSISIPIVPRDKFLLSNIESSQEVINYLGLNENYFEKIKLILISLNYYEYSHDKIVYFSKVLRKEQGLSNSKQFLDYLKRKNISLQNLSWLYSNILKIYDFLKYNF